MFNCDNTIISWRFIKQTMMTTLLSHLQILIIHEASHECILLRSIFQHIRESYKLSFVKDNLTILYEDNVACIA